ncbi:MAG TPA: nucleotidyltransferase family protein [Chitinophagaceae bacterium]|nr:nucleotidyltransferase family protein [Chitinophagaceae bacterium]
MKAMILAAGLGTRLKPWTDQHPKALAEVNGKPLLQRNIEYLQTFGIKDVLVNVHHFADQIIQAIDNNEGWGSAISISDETDAVLETGGGLVHARWFFDEDDFVLMNVDILTDLDILAMRDYHQRHRPLSTLAVTNRESSRYFLFDERNDLCGWRNMKTGEEKLSTGHPVFTQKAFSGIHIINPALFDHVQQTGKFSMVDVYLDLARKYTIKAYDHSQGKLLDVGKPESVVKAGELFK